MNREDFNRIIHNSGSVDRQMVGEVRELIDLFPYFQCAHLLLLKGLHNISDVRFESQLKQSAIFVADREVLYHLLNNKPELSDDYKEVPKPENGFGTISESKPGNIAETVAGVKPDAVIESLVPDQEQTVIESGNNSEEIIQELSSQSLTRTVLVKEESDDDDSANLVFLLEDEGELKDERIIYMDPSIYVPDKDDLLELDLQESGSTESETEAGDIQKKEEEADFRLSRKLKQADLIDKFIIANPRIEPVRDKTAPSGVDISKPFTEEKGGFITETLAKIYVSQGYYSKAIDIYEKLSLKFPEKSSYFATQIEKVKELIK